MPGKVTLVGAGPGDPGLLTRKGLEALERADVVVYDRLVSPAILALMPEGAVKINVGKEASRHPVPQEQINRILLEQAQQGHNVVRLKGGDPFLFGRGGEELELLAEHRIPFEEVPGITIDSPAPNKIIISGPDKQQVGQFAAEVREKRPPEPYKGKGIKYATEVIRRKEGKTGGKKK